MSEGPQVNCRNARIRRLGPRGWIIAGIVLVCGVAVGVPTVAIATYAINDARGVVTVVTNADGSERTVRWRDYPGSAEIDSQEVLAGPSLDEGIDTGEVMVAGLERPEPQVS